MEEKKKKNSKPEETEIEAEETAGAAEGEENIEAEENKPAEKSELEKANEQIAGLSDKLMRTAAEFDNFKKRTARERDEFYKLAVCETIEPMLPVLDNLKRAVSAAEEAGGDSVMDGVKMIKKQFEDALTAIGVEEIPAVGCEFDPEKHNAVMTGESDEKENTVLEEFQKGYIYKDKVIRHSMVKVSN